MQFRILIHFVFGCLLMSSIGNSQTVLRNSVVGSGYTQSNDSSTLLRGTLGQTAVFTVSDSATTVAQGYWYQISRDIVTGIEDQNLLPAEFELKQNYPNPFNPSTTILFSLPQAAEVQLTIYNVLGQEVGTLVDENLSAGTYEVRFEARGLAAGLYFYRIQADRFVETRKMLLVK
ncbi:MAG: T9SS type A sorting domain-containing protein [Calditrichia bacterium]